VLVSGIENGEQVDLRDLIGHREWVAADCALELVHKQFGTHSHDFMAVLDGGKVLGVCSRHDIGMRLGARYGFTLFSRKPAGDYLSASPVWVPAGQAVGEVLATVFSRESERFYDDVVLVDADGGFLGLIHVHTLVRLQTGFLQDNIRLLERQKQVIREKNQQMEDDLTMAREIQLALLPRKRMSFPAGVNPDEAPLRFAQLYVPAQKVGGDFVHVVPISDDSIGIFIADVMGHGVRSALVTAMLRALVEEIGSSATDPGRFLNELNRNLAAILSQTGEMMFATAFYLIADAGAGTLRYARAGHPCPIRLRRDTGTVETLECRRPVAGPGLCVFKEAVYGTAEAELGGDDTILLFTDGLIEASDPEGELFGTERLEECVGKCAALGAPALVDAVFGAAVEFLAGGGFDDDVCLVALDVVQRKSAVDRTTDPRREIGAFSG
jgi:phosphoserine phosphatase RsbU/P